MSHATRLHIHAGLPKSGTTALQKFLISNRALLSSAGLYLPETGLDPRGNHHAVIRALGSFNPVQRAAMARRFRAEIGRELLVSSEFASLMVRFAKGAAGFRSLTAQGFELHFYLYLRPQADLAVSSYPEFLRNLLYPQSFEAYLQRSFAGLADYAGLVARLSEIAPGRVRILPYSKDHRTGGIWWPLFEAIGMSLPRRKLSLPGEVHPSLRAPAVAALETALQRLDPELRHWSRRRKLRETLLRETDALPSAGPRYNPFPPKARRAISARYAEANAALAARHWPQSWAETFAAEESEAAPLSLYNPANPDQKAAHEAALKTLDHALQARLTRLRKRAGRPGLHWFGRPFDYSGDQVLRFLLARRITEG